MKPAEFLMCFEKYSIVINVGDGPHRVGIIDVIGIQAYSNNDIVNHLHST